MGGTGPAGNGGQQGGGSLISQLLQTLQGNGSGRGQQAGSEASGGAPGNDSSGSGDGSDSAGTGGGASASGSAALQTAAGGGPNAAELAALLQQLSASQGGGQAQAAGGGQAQAAGRAQSGTGSGQQAIGVPELLQMVVQHLGSQNGGGGTQAPSGGGSTSPQGSGGSGASGGGGGGQEVEIPLKDVLQLALSGGQGQGGASGGSSAGGHGQSSVEMQLSQELAANLKKLKAILAETQDLAQRIESVLAERSDEAGTAGHRQSAPKQGQGQGRRG